MATGRYSEKRRIAERRRYSASRELGAARNRAKNRKLRADIVAAYGARCVCCGEDEDRFLTLDHIHGRGGKDRRDSGTTYTVWARLRREGYPRDDFQLLCFNCNCGRALNGGVCPHEERIDAVLRLVA